MLVYASTVPLNRPKSSPLYAWCMGIVVLCLACTKHKGRQSALLLVTGIPGS